MTLVPRVLLSATLAGPAPSGSTDASRLCRGCSRPPRRFPGQAAPSFAALLRQGQQWKVSHLHSNRQRLTAHVVRGLAGCCSQRKLVELEILIPSASVTDFETEANSG